MSAAALGAVGQNGYVSDFTASSCGTGNEASVDKEGRADAVGDVKIDNVFGLKRGLGADFGEESDFG